MLNMFNKINGKLKKKFTKEDALDVSLRMRVARKKNPSYKFFGNTPIEAVKVAYDRGAKMQISESGDLKKHEDKRMNDLVFDCENCGAEISRVFTIECFNMIQGNDFNMLLCIECKEKLWDEIVEYVAKDKGMTICELYESGILHDYNSEVLKDYD